MSNANRDYAIVYDVKNSSLVLSRPLIFYITDQNTSNIFVRLVTKVNIGDGVDQYTDIEEASSYVLTMRVIKPNNEVNSIEATQHEEASIFQFDLTEDFKDIPGKYTCELIISNIVSGRQELITSDPFNYEVKRSILSNISEIIETEDTTVEKLLNNLEASKARLFNDLELAKTNLHNDLESTKSELGSQVQANDNKIENIKGELSSQVQANDNKIENIKGELSSQIKEKANFSDMKYSYLENDSMICVTYDNENPRNYKLMITFDGVTFNKIDNLELEGWDYCLAYHNGYYYLSYDYMSSDFNPSNYPYFTGGDKVAILKTKDFVTYNKIDIQLPSFFKQALAPELFFEGNNLHMFFSGCDLTNTSVDNEGVTQYIKYTYYTVSTDDGSTWSNPVKINLLNNKGVLDEGNKIDPAIIEKNGKYYLFLKNEHEKFIEEYESEAINGDYKLINTLKDRYFVEAPAICYFNGQYYLYCDMYATGKYVYYTSTDLKKWSKSNILSIASNEVMRHFTPCKVYDNQLLKDIVKRNGYDPLVDDYKTSNDTNMFICDLENKTYGSLSVKPNAIYKLSGVDDCIINSLDISNLNKGDRCYFFIATDYASLIIKNNTQGVYLQDNEVVLNKAYQCHNRLIEFICVDVQPTLCVLNYSNINELVENSTTTFSEELIDDTTSIKATFIKRNKIVQGNFVCQLSKDVDTGLYTMSFKAPFLPIADAYNTVFMGYNENGNFQFRSVKIFFDGRVEVRTTTPIKAGGYFECSVTYIEK